VAAESGEIFPAGVEKFEEVLMKTLVIAEKPSVAQDIVRAITRTAGKF
jgi:DNA topoisomerase-3